MPLSKAAPRRHMHTREIVCRGFQRDDGLWDIEGEITDTKTYSFENQDRGGVAAGEPVHRMLVRLTLDDDLVVRAAEAATDGSPYTICPVAAEAYAGLAGLKIAAGWRREVRKRVAATAGCTHITDLIVGPLAVTAYQTIVPKRRREEAEASRSAERPRNIDTCYALRADGPVIERQWPAHFSGASDSED